MRKGFTLVEMVIVLFIVGAFLIVGYGSWNRISVSDKCLAHGYVPATPNRYSKYCSKVKFGNTVIVHVDSLR